VQKSEASVPLYIPLLAAVLSASSGGQAASEDKARAVARDYVEATVLFLGTIGATHPAA
jgi:hypothetical protein